MKEAKKGRIKKTTLIFAEEMEKALYLHIKYNRQDSILKTSKIYNF